MDPEACLNEAEKALFDGDTDTCRERLEAFREWADMFGFTDTVMLARADKIGASLATYGGIPHVHGEHHFTAIAQADGAVRLVCVDPIFSDTGEDLTPWPDDALVAQWTGKAGLALVTEETTQAEAFYRIKEGT